ncbi:hypothetical protein [Mesorhizobium sp. M7A.F.Ca.US.008.03.1.1]|uniref:hypothetical protein n=1 Tax=Mesorhizobium sp. M7A.F.Ca.US.008.03.1.1 TaxID=2496742 RepID=UPI000FCA23FB|nr:hypothetical protein [Mesorhizobium sp. M7A.F.Ca.US.008.03.1.1]RUW63201.1 hypothetical protein EOA16_03505 [Mesorhizobium sp. M7A.F.Ca.US.008.03.1.1]
MSHYYAQTPRIPIAKQSTFADKLKTIYVVVGVIAMSLQSVYLPQFGMAAFCYLGLLMLIPLLNAPVKANVFWIVAFLLVGMCGTLATAEDGGTKAVLGTIGSSLALILVPACFAKDTRPLLIGLRWAIAAHALMVLFQIIYFAAFRTYFDPLASLGLGDQAVMSKKGLELAVGRVPRFAGLSNEPGTHSTMIASLLAGEYALSRKLSKVSILGILSAIATMSLGGMMFVAMFCGVVGLHQFFAVRKWRLLVAAIGTALLSVMIYWALLNLETRSQLYVEGTQHDQMMEWAFSYQRITLFGLSESQIPIFFTFGYLGVGLDFLLRYGLWAVIGVAVYLLSLPLLGIGLSIVLLATKLKLTYPLVFVILATINLGMTQNPYAKLRIHPRLRNLPTSRSPN